MHTHGGALPHPHTKWSDPTSHPRSLCEQDWRRWQETRKQRLPPLCGARSPSTNFKSTLRTLRILKVRNSYLRNSQGQKLTLRIESDLKKILNFLIVTFRNRKNWLISLLTAYLYTVMVSRFGAPKKSLEWYDTSKCCSLADLEKTLLTLRKQNYPCKNKADFK